MGHPQIGWDGFIQLHNCKLNCPPASSNQHPAILTHPGVFERIVQQQVAGVEQEVSTLKTEAERLAAEIAELSSEAAPMMA